MQVFVLKGSHYFYEEFYRTYHLVFHHCTIESDTRFGTEISWRCRYVSHDQAPWMKLCCKIYKATDVAIISLLTDPHEAS